MENMMLYVLAYTIGAIPFGLILSKIFMNTDLRDSGSGSIGATNVYRVLKEQNPSLAKKLSVATILLDAIKGLIPILVAFYIVSSDYSVLWMMGILSIMGHCFSPFLGFTGGKGVATSLGVGVFFLPLEVLIGVIVWALFAKFFKISSISSLAGVLGFCVSSFFLHSDMPYIDTHAPVLIITFIVFYQHIPNIIRLFKKEELEVI